MRSPSRRYRQEARHKTAVRYLAGSVLVLVSLLSAGAKPGAAPVPNEVWGWGWDCYGQLGDNAGCVTRQSPVQALGLTNVTQIAAGGFFTLALTADGQVWGWGQGDHGQLATAPPNNVNKLVPVMLAGMDNAIAITAGGTHSVVLKSDRTVWTVGLNHIGQLGVGHSNPVFTATQVNISDVVAIDTGGLHTLAVKADGTLWAWGWNALGQLGTGNTSDAIVPVQVLGLPNPAVDPVVAAQAMPATSVALTASGEVYAWGWNQFGFVGDGTTATRSLPVRVLGGVAALGDLAAASYHVLVVKLDGTVWGWGDNFHGQLGIAPPPPPFPDNPPYHPDQRNSPIQLTNPELNGTVRVATGWRVSLALKADGSVWAFGRNNTAQLGQPVNPSDPEGPHPTPTQVANLPPAVAIAGGTQHSIALTGSMAPVDTTAPVVLVSSDMTVEADGPQGAPASFAASATDDVDGEIAPACSPEPGSLFPLGSTAVVCSATDAAGNIGSAMLTVNVVDTTPPLVTTSGDVTVEATSPAGAAAAFTVSAVDRVDESPAVGCSPASGSTFALGSTTVTCTATDDFGNSASSTLTVRVVDTTPPVLTVPANLSRVATSAGGAVATFSASATDIADPSVDVACTPGSGSVFPIGTTTANCTATDDSGNAASGSFTVSVGYNVCPLYDASKLHNSGSTVPVKLRLCTASGQNLSSPSVAVTAVSLVLLTTNAEGVVEDSGQANPDGNFRYDASLAGYIFNLQTKGLIRGTYELRFTAGAAPGMGSAAFKIR